MAANEREREGLRLLLLVVVLFSLFRYFHELAKILLESQFIDFAHYHTYAFMVLRGLDPFDPQAVLGVDQLLHIRRAGAAANYPPLFYLFMAPWTLLPFRPIAVTWLLASQACLLGVLALCFRDGASASPIRAAVALFVVLNYQPLLESLALGQINVLVLLLVSLAWWGLRADRSWLTVAAVAIVSHIKVQYGLLLLLLWWMGYRVVVARAVSLALLGLGVSWVALGPAHHLEYLRYVLSLPDYLLTWTRNISPRATLHRLFESVSQGGALADVLWLALCASVLVFVVRAVPRALPPGSPAIDWAWGLGLAAVLLLSPLTEEHHLVVLLLPITLLLRHETEVPIPTKEMAVLVVSLLLLGSRYSLERFPAFHQGALSLLMTGKLLGIFGLGWLLICRLRVPNVGN